MCATLRSWIPSLYAQHLYENDALNYSGPEFICTTHPIHLEPLERAPLERKILYPNGGGKDSYLAMRLLSDAGFKIGSFSSARSEYGKFTIQHRLQENNLKNLASLQACHQVSVADDITDWHWIGNYYPEIKGECAQGRPNQVGTPEMLFYALPMLLTDDYTDIAMGWERSAEFVQAYAANGKEVNHQFLKSLVAEQRYRTFIYQFVSEDINLYGVLRPIFDYKLGRLWRRL